MQNALELKNICKIFGDVKALDDINFEVKKGEWVNGYSKQWYLYARWR